VNNISTSAGFAKGTIYNYFPTKRALMLALIDEIGGDHFAYLADRVLAEPDPVQRLYLFFSAGFDWVEENLPPGRVMLATLNGPDMEFKQRMHAAYRPLFELVGVEIIGLGIKKGVFRVLEPATTAGMVMTIYLGFGSTVDDRGKPSVPPDQIADLVLKGIQAV
jgi:AcrR family transcriptional regulator